MLATRFRDPNKWLEVLRHRVPDARLTQPHKHLHTSATRCSNCG